MHFNINVVETEDEKDIPCSHLIYPLYKRICLFLKLGSI